jgi:hypothetical protein
MSVSVDTALDFEIRDVEHLDGWFAQAMQMPAWTAHLGWHGGGMLFRDRSSKGLERIHLVTYDEPSREAFVSDLYPLADALAGGEMLAVERYRTDDNWHAWFFFMRKSTQ